MDGFLYPASLILMAILAFTFNKTNNNILALLAIVVGIYIVYSHETGYTATDFKNDMVESAKESTDDLAKSYNVEGYDEQEYSEELE